MDQATISRRNNEIRTGRMLRHYPAIAALHAAVAGSRPKKDETARFTIEMQQPDGSFCRSNGALTLTSPVARKLADTAEALAKQNPGRRVRVIRPGAARAVLCYRFDSEGNALSY
jgi:hypothetical protein